MTPSSPHRVRKNFSGMGLIGLFQTPTGPARWASPRANIFRVETAVAILAAAYVVLRRLRASFAVAALVALSALVAVLLYRYVDVPSVGPIPSMYERIWFFDESLSAVAEGVAGVLAVVVFLVSTSRT